MVAKSRLGLLYELDSLASSGGLARTSKSQGRIGSDFSGSESVGGGGGGERGGV